MQSFNRRHRHSDDADPPVPSDVKALLDSNGFSAPSSFPSSLSWRTRLSSHVPVRRDVLLSLISLLSALVLWTAYSTMTNPTPLPFLSSPQRSEDMAVTASLSPSSPTDSLIHASVIDTTPLFHPPTPSLGPSTRQWLYVQTLHYGDYQHSLQKFNELSYLTMRARCFSVLQDYSWVLNLGRDEMKAVIAHFIADYPAESKSSHIGLTAFGFDKTDPLNPERVIHMPELSGPWYRVLLIGLALYQPQLLLRYSSMSYASTRLHDAAGKAHAVDYVLFSDVDAVVSNVSRPLDDLIRALPPRCWLIVQDLEYLANAGIVILRQSMEARQFVTLWLDQWLTREPEQYWQADQGAMMESILLWLSQYSHKYKGKVEYEPGLCWNLRSNNDSVISRHPALQWMRTWNKADGTSQDQVWIQNACFGSILKHWGFENKERINLDGICLLPVYDSKERPDQAIYRFNCHWCGQRDDWFIHHEWNRNWGQYKNYTRDANLLLGEDPHCQFEPATNF